MNKCKHKIRLESNKDFLCLVCYKTYPKCNIADKPINWDYPIE